MTGAAHDVYLAIKYHEDHSNRALVEVIRSHLTRAGLSSFCVAAELERWGAVSLTPAELMSRTFDVIEASRVILVEFSEKGVGLGIEAGYATAREIPVIVAHPPDTDVSTTLRGVAAVVFEYSDRESLDQLAATGASTRPRLKAGRFEMPRPQAPKGVTQPAVGGRESCPPSIMAPVTARYDAVAASYAADDDRYDGSAVSALLDLIGTDTGGRALDLACGHGLLARELARRGATVAAIDLSHELLERARSHDLGANLEIEYIQGDVADPDVLDGTEFDLVVSNFGLSDIDDLEGACRTVARVLVPGGRFVFSILHPCFAGAPGVSGSWPTGTSYYDEGWWRADGELSVLRQAVGANHRMLSTYLNSLARNGLAIDQVLEPRPEGEWAEHRPGAGTQPVYLVVLCRRIAS